MINLAASESIELLTGASVVTDFVASYRNPLSPAVPLAAQAAPSTATTTTMVSGPAEVSHFVVKNRSTTTAQTVTIKKDVSGTEYHLTPAVTLQVGEALEYQDGAGFRVLDAAGRVKAHTSDGAGTTGYTLDFYKIGITSEAAGQWYTWALNPGYPGAWSPGAEGVNGRVTDGNAAADAGALPYVNAASGANYLTGFSGSSSVACRMALFDVLWVNDALDVTVTTEQVIDSPAFPARDLNGAVSGAGVQVGILVTTATGQGGALTDITLNYTNSAGTAAQTGTMASFPATATAGTVVWFELEAGDSGVRSVEGITIGTTMTSGAISLIAARRLAAFSVGTANVGGAAAIDPRTGIRLYDDSCLLLMARTSATTAMTCEGEVTIATR